MQVVKNDQIFWNIATRNIREYKRTTKCKESKMDRISAEENKREI